VLPASRTEMAIVGPIVKNELLLFTLTLALAVGWMLTGAGRGRAGGAPSATPGRQAGPPLPPCRGASRPRRGSREISWRRSLAALGVLVVGLLAGFLRIARAHPGGRAGHEARTRGRRGGVRVRAPGRRPMPSSRRRSPRGRPLRGGRRCASSPFACGRGRTSLDACEICGPTATSTKGRGRVPDCTSPIALGSLGRRGGCNPIPVASRIEGSRVVVSLANSSGRRRSRGVADPLALAPAHGSSRTCTPCDRALAVHPVPASRSASSCACDVRGGSDEQAREHGQRPPRERRRRSSSARLTPRASPLISTPPGWDCSPPAAEGASAMGSAVPAQRRAPSWK